MNRKDFVWRAGRRVAPWLAGAWLLGAPVSFAQSSRPLSRAATCSLATLVDDLRAALRDGSPSLQRYMRLRLKESAMTLSSQALREAVERETDPDVLEVLGQALASQAGNAQDPALLQSLLQRASKDSDPALRAAAVRGLRGVGSVELLQKGGEGVNYEQLVRDPSPEVRAAVTDNLVHESAKVYFGHDKAVSETAVSTALASPDPEVAARLLSEVSMEQVGPETVSRLTGQLRAENPKLRAAAATALGGVPSASAASARTSLVDLYRSEKDASVRKAALEGIAHLGQAGALPVLQSLRGVDPAMDAEVDAWVKALGTGLQEWHLLLREKQRLRK